MTNDSPEASRKMNTDFLFGAKSYNASHTEILTPPFHAKANCLNASPT
jgi:hypothetical protein